jgi:hypothetical protein
MLRRDISAALLASATGAVLLPKSATATTCTAPCYATTYAENAAKVTVVNNNYPPLWADRYGTNATPGLTDMTAAINAAVSVAAIQGGSPGPAMSGERVILQATTYKTSSPIVISTGVTVQGAGGYGINYPSDTIGSGTCILYSGAANTGAIQLGNSMTSLTAFPAVADLGITLTTAETYGVQFLCTANGSARNIFVLNAFPKTIQSQNGFVIGAASGAPTVSCFFNTLINCYAQFVHQGFVFDNGGGTMNPTQTTFLQCSALGMYNLPAGDMIPSDTTGNGVSFAQPGDGVGSTFVGCYFENFATGVYLNGTNSVTFTGTYFEACGNDIRWSGSDQAVTFFGLYPWTQTGTPGTACGVVNGS